MADPRELPTAGPAQAERLHRFAHDLKNRLGGLWASLRMVHELPAGAERDELMAHAERTYYRGLNAIEALLDDLGVERGPTAGPLRSVPTLDLVERVRDELAFRFERKGQRVQLDIPAGHALTADPDLLHQAMTAVLSNASKFGAPNGVTTVQAVPGGIAITDDGAGLSPEDLAQVFTPYAWLSSLSTAGEEQGRGSLARAQRAMRAQGGRIEARSEGPGHGSTFVLRLPA
jgi:signal transduction histidine kinase